MYPYSRGRHGRRADPGAGGKTPLEYAQTPNMDRMAREGASGLLHTIPDGFEPGSDIANMSILGYAPEKSTRDGARSKR